MTTEESQLLATVRFNNFDAGSRPFRTELTEKGTDLHLQGWIDYGSHLGYAQVTGSFTPQALLWNGKTVGVHDSAARCRRQPGAAHPRPGRPGLGQPSAGRLVRPGSMPC